MKQNCIDCGAEFEITDGEKSFFESKGFTLPKRCKSCRAKKKAERQAQGSYNG